MTFRSAVRMVDKERESLGQREAYFEGLFCSWIFALDHVSFPVFFMTSMCKGIFRKIIKKADFEAKFFTYNLVPREIF